MSTTLKDLRGTLHARQAQLSEIFEQAGTDLDMSKVTALDGDTNAKVERVRALNDECADLQAQIDTELKTYSGLQDIRDRVDAMRDVDQPMVHPGQDGGRRAATRTPRTMGEMFVESPAYKGHKIGAQAPGPLAELDLDFNDLRAANFTTAAGWAPETLRTGRVVDKALRPVQVIDLIDQANTTQSAVVYMEETTATSAAAERAEAGAYAESSLALTERSVTIRSIGTSLPVTDEQLEDVAQAQSYVDGRLGFFVMQRLDSQILTGDGIAPNITGFLNASGLQTQAKGADPVPDAIYKAMVKVRVTGRAFPNACVLHPNDWQDIRLLRTADGVYIWGSPSEAGPERIWGALVVQSDALTENTGLVGDFTAAMCQLYVKRGLEVQIGYVNDNFSKGMQTVRAGIRATLVVYRGAAYSTVTGI